MSIPAIDRTSARTGGVFIPALPVHVTAERGEVVSVIDAPTALKMVVDGLTLTTAKTLTPEQDELRSVYVEVQRLVEAQKKKNHLAFSSYIEELHTGKRDLGYIPPVALWTSDQLEYDETTGQVFIPSDISLFPFDGDTQLNAWRRVFERTSRKERMDWLMTGTVKVSLYWGQPTEWAQQAFHDANTKGVRVNASQSLAMDRTDPATRLTNLVAERAEIEVDRQHRQLGKASTALFTLSTLRQGILTSLFGMSGIQYGSRSVDDRIDEADERRLEPIITEAWTAILNHPDLAPKFRDRENYVIASPAIVAAIGALVNDVVVEGADHDPETLLDDYLLRVDWTKTTPEGDHPWDGIIGKTVPNTNRDGVILDPPVKFIIAAGPKESGYQAYAAISALRDPIAL